MSGIKKLSIDVTYTAVSGYGSRAGFKGDDKTSATVEQAIKAALTEIGLVAARHGIAREVADFYPKMTADWLLDERLLAINPDQSQ